MPDVCASKYGPRLHCVMQMVLSHDVASHASMQQASCVIKGNPSFLLDLHVNNFCTM